MKKLALLLFVVLVACSSGPSETVNFSGEWELDIENSDLGNRPDGARQQMNPERQPGAEGEQGDRPGRRVGFNARNVSISQTQDVLSVTRTFEGRDGEEMTAEEKYNLKGQKSLNETRMGEKTSTAGWDKSGKILTIVSEQIMDRGDQTFTMKSSETWTLISEDELEIVSTMSTPRGERTRKLLYFKN